jgi:hypothetical protein
VVSLQADSTVRDGRAPHYAGALGAALVVDTVSTADALIFLAGTNLGAALYEYAAARATRAFLPTGRAASSDEFEPAHR